MEPHLNPPAHHPRISVLLPVYNGEKFLREAVDSVLAQTFTDFEFIIVDDGSTDDSVNIIRSYSDERIRLLKLEQNCGISVALNQGLSVAVGEFIARMDSDDICDPKRFAAQVQFLDDHPSIDIVGCSLEIIDPHSQPTGEIWEYFHSALGLRWRTFFDIPVAHPAVMMRRWIVDTGVRYTNDHKQAEDFGLWSALNLKVHFSNIQRVLLKYRIHRLSVSKSQDLSQYEQACDISHWSVSSYLGKEIPIESIRLIRLPYREPSLAKFTSTITLLRQLFEKFKQENSFEPADAVYIDLDLARKFFRVSRENPQFISAWLVQVTVIGIVIRAFLFDWIKNDHSETHHLLKAIQRNSWRNHK